MSFICNIPKNKYILIGSLLVIAALSALYIYQVSAVTELAYRIAEREQQVAELSDRTSNLETRYASSATFRQIDELAESLGYQRIDTMQYVTVDTSRVAQQD